MQTKRYAKMIFLCFCFTMMAKPGITETCTWTEVSRIVAVGDVHGDFNRFVETLRAAGVINPKNEWIAGETHLVQTGDILDRGPDSRKVMDLLMDLETQAQKAGGFVHSLIGNHEAMNLLGDLRYVHPGEYESYGGQEGFLKAMNPATGQYGKWISAHNAVIKINDILFVHGGLGPEYMSMTCDAINDSIQKELAQPDIEVERIADNPEGPLWYRGYTKDPEPEITKHLDTLFNKHGVNHIVVGHTVAKDGINVRCGGKVIMIDVGLAEHYGGPINSLLVEDNRYYSVYPEKRVELFKKD